VICWLLSRRSAVTTTPSRTLPTAASCAAADVAIELVSAKDMAADNNSSLRDKAPSLCIRDIIALLF